MAKAAKEKLSFTAEITQRDISRGKKTAEKCPIALAIVRTLAKIFGRKKVTYIMVDNSISFDITRRKVETNFYADTPAKAKKFWNNFDDGKKVKPFKFVVKAVGD